jgi:hypothetical protein
MTTEEWKAFVRAWAAWVNNEGPPVQRMYDGKWYDHPNENAIQRCTANHWRVKPRAKLARMFIRQGVVGATWKIEGTPCAEPLPGDQWIGDWHEVPE